MNASDVERLTRDVIVDRGLPFTILSVSRFPSGWNLAVRTDTGAIVRFAVFDGTPVAMRTAIQDMLEAEF